MVPELVVPPVATTANTSLPSPRWAASCASSAARSASPVIRPWASMSTGSTLQSITRAAARTEACTSRVAAMVPRASLPVRSRCT